MPPTKNIEAGLYDHAHKLLRAHETLLRDTVRNQAFYRALQKCVTSDSVVLDIGAGTGIWAITAAKLGAKKVVAVETDALLTGLIRLLAEEQGVAAKVEIVCGSSFNVQLEKEFDIVISETVGYLGYDENIVEIMIDARRRFLKKGGWLIPETVSLFAAAGHLKTEKETVPSGLPFDFKQLAGLNLNSPRTLDNKRDLKLITEPQPLIQVDLYQADTAPHLENLRAKWSVPNTAAINCFAVWVESRLTGNVNLSTRRTASWLPYIYRINSVEETSNQVEFNLSLTRASNYWATTFSNGSNGKTQSYSPEFAATELLLRSRTDDSVLIELHSSRIKTLDDFSPCLEKLE